MEIYGAVSEGGYAIADSIFERLAEGGQLQSGSIRFTQVVGYCQV